MSEFAPRASFEPRDPHYQARVEASFKHQRVMQTLRVSLVRVAPGVIELGLPYQPELTQQHGFMHAGVLATALDSACGYAAFSLMPPDAAVLTVEFKVNLLAPAQGDQFRVVGRVVKSGRTISVCEGLAYAQRGDDAALVATMAGTIMAVYDRPGVHQ